LVIRILRFAVGSTPPGSFRSTYGRATAPRILAVAYRHRTLLRTEIELREAGKLETATDYVTSVDHDKHGYGEVAAKIQAHIIVAVV
jgi:hypothetical protein